MSRVADFLSRSLAAAERVFEVLDTGSDVRDAERPVPLPRIEGHVEFKNVTFGYEAHKPVLHEVSFSVAPGEMIGLVGQSGAGKSTTINLICRFYEVQEGAVAIDGLNIKQIAQKDLRSQIGGVLQEPFLFSGSIYDNIAFARPGRGDVVVDRTAEEKRFLEHHPDLRAKVLLRNLFDVQAVDGDRALLHLVEAAYQVDRGALARAALAHESDHLARRDTEAHFVKHRFVGLVTEGHILELHMPFDARQRHRSFSIPHVGPGIQHLEDALRCSQRARKEVRDAAHELQWAVKLGQIAEEGEELAQREDLPVGQQLCAERGVLNDLIPADVPDDEVADAHDEEENREERDPHVLGRHVGVIEFPAVPAKSLDFAVLFGEGADDAYTGQAVADRRGQAAVQVPGSTPDVHHAIPRELREEQDHRRGNEDQQGELPVHPEKHDADADEEQDVREENLDALDEHGLQRLRVVGHTRDQRARLAFVEILEGKSLKMAEDLIAEILRELLAQAHGHPAPPDAQRLAEELHTQ